MKTSLDASNARGGLLVTMRIACATALVAAVAVASSSTSGAAPHAADASPNITIVQTAAATQGACQARSQSLTYTTANTPTAFTMTVIASAPLCDPVTDAAAVIYQMPGHGVAWPQELLEVQRFTISQAGVTTITFTKTCVPVQFDVVTGETPQTISPLGPWHGPLLFPFDTNTSYQHWGSACVEPTTTLATTTTTHPATTTTHPTTTTTHPTTTTTHPATTTTHPTTTTTQPATTTTLVSGGGEGCTPGYWKQSQHFGSWVGYQPSDTYDTVFGVTSSFGAATTLLEALGMNGGGEMALARHATAALLNAASTSVDFKYTTAQVIAIVQNAYTTGDFESAKDLLADQNEMECTAVGGTTTTLAPTTTTTHPATTTTTHPATTSTTTTSTSPTTTAAGTTTTAPTTTAPSTTTSSTTTTTAAVSATTSTTSPSGVLGTTVSSPSGVLGATASRSSAGANGTNLAATGATSTGPALVALVLLTVGVAALTIRRRRLNS